MNKLRNNVLLIGNLGVDPEKINLESGKSLTKCRMATNESYRDNNGELIKETQWHNLVAWGKTADYMHDTLQQGSEVAVNGKIINRTYEDKDGQKKYISEIVVNEFLALNNKN